MAEELKKSTEVKKETPKKMTTSTNKTKTTTAKATSKTTLFNLLTGVYEPSEGSVTLDGHLLNGKAPYKIASLGLSRTFQNIRLFKDLTVLENVLIAFGNHHKAHVFASFFGGGGASRNPNAPRQGDDLQYRVNLKFEEAIFGTDKEIKYNREATCHTCHGSGAKPGTSPVTCSRCHGAGVINVDTQTPLGMMRRQVTCDVCHGRGQEIKDPCQTCHGTGHEKQAHSVHVKIPAGVETGQQVRLSGQGEAGFNGGPYGDLYVVVQVESSDKFERDGSTIYYKLNLNFVQAALGDSVEIPTVHGDVELTIPEGTQTGKRFRLRGKGAPSLRGGSMGDQYVTVNVVTPTGLNDKQKAALKDFAEAGDIKVNPKKKGFFDKMKDAFEGE